MAVINSAKSAKDDGGIMSSIGPAITFCTLIVSIGPYITPFYFIWTLIILISFVGLIWQAGNYRKRFHAPERKKSFELPPLRPKKSSIASPVENKNIVNSHNKGKRLLHRNGRRKITIHEEIMENEEFEL